MITAPKTVFLLVFLTLATTVSAKEKPLEVYQARIGTQDHFNSKGNRLKSAAGIIRQDRANYHKFNKKDPDDQSDIFFAKRKNRKLFEQMLGRGTLNKAAQNAILSGNPLIQVSIYQNLVKVVVVKVDNNNLSAWATDAKPKIVDGCKSSPHDGEISRVVYIARLSSVDHFNSKGKRLNSAASIINQDRANYHRFKKRDSADQYDVLFSERKNRDWFGELLSRCLKDRKLKNAILDHTPLVRVTVTTYPGEIGYNHSVIVELLSL
jgi:hypothetical protein